MSHNLGDIGRLASGLIIHTVGGTFSKGNECNEVSKQSALYTVHVGISIRSCCAPYLSDSVSTIVSEVLSRPDTRRLMPSV